MNRGVLIGGIVLVSTIFAVWFIAALRAKPRTPQQAVLSFVSYTNFGVPGHKGGVKYERFAAFRLTNASPVRVACFAKSIELWTEAGWVTNWIRGTPTNWPHFGSSFGPGEGGVFYVPPPTNRVWRIRLGFQEHATGWRGYRDRFQDLRANRGSTVQSEQFSGRIYEVSSSEVQ